MKCSFTQRNVFSKFVRVEGRLSSFTYGRLFMFVRNLFVGIAMFSAFSAHADDGGIVGAVTAVVVAAMDTSGD